MRSHPIVFASERAMRESAFKVPTSVKWHRLQSVLSRSVTDPGLFEDHRLKEPLIKYREAVPTSSPGLPPRLPWVTNSNPPQPLWGCALFHVPIPNVAAERQRWAGGRYRFAVGNRHRSTLVQQPTSLSRSDIQSATLASALQIFPSMTRAKDRSPRASPRSNGSIHSTSDNCSRPESEYFG